ncbi:MAG: hypothetical protein AUG51_23025 [Acidobacteria bacterium 13_1_20CM_3_53_8]|nr:MAG: hypothetical protein AUG51_23025 [Acidobacteria bacterium 13_1_20CM_3_53_8]
MNITIGIKRAKAYCCCLLFLSFYLLPFTFCLSQQVVDRMVATVNGGVRTDLITYSDLVWQLALQPDTPVERPSSEDLNHALQILISQRLIIQEAEKIPTITPTDEEVRNELNDLIQRFPGKAAELYQRAASAGLTREHIDEIMRERVEISKYLNFRFRSFVVVTPQEVSDYYRQTYVPRFRQRSPGRIIPTLDEARAEIEKTLTESKIESETDEFLDAARDRAEVVILSSV